MYDSAEFLHNTMVKFATEHNLLGKVIVNAGGSMLVHGLRKVTLDIDVSVSHDDWFALREANPTATVRVVPAYSGCVPIVILEMPDEIDVHIHPDDAYGPGIIDWRDGVGYEPMTHVCRRKMLMDREKDQEDIARLKEFLGWNSREL